MKTTIAMIALMGMIIGLNIYSLMIILETQDAGRRWHNEVSECFHTGGEPMSRMDYLRHRFNGTAQ
jgi:hypothetical protein